MHVLPSKSKTSCGHGLLLDIQVKLVTIFFFFLFIFPFILYLDKVLRGVLSTVQKFLAQIHHLLIWLPCTTTLLGVSYEKDNCLSKAIMRMYRALSLFYLCVLVSIYV